MRYWFAGLFLFPHLVLAEDLVIAFDASFGQSNIEAPGPEMNCESVVCINRTEVTSVPTLNITPAPVKKSNETLDAVGSALYFIGEMGLAENLSDDNYRRYPSN